MERMRADERNLEWPQRPVYAQGVNDALHVLVFAGAWRAVESKAKKGTVMKIIGSWPSV